MAARSYMHDLLALATMPGLEALGGVLARHDPSRRGPRCGHVALVIYLAARWVTAGSASRLDAELQTGRWAQMRLAALRVGRTLPEQTPTYEALRQLRLRVDGQGDGAFLKLTDDLSEEFTKVAVELAQGIGLLRPGTPDYAAVRRGNCVVADGSTFKPASDLSEDDDGNVAGSRATHGPGSLGPRVVPARPGKPGKDALYGVPVVAASVRDARKHSRVVLAIQAVMGGNETGAARTAIGRLVGVAGADAVHAMSYDGLLQGADIRRVMQLGVLPVVAMPKAGIREPHVKVPDVEARSVREGKSRKTRVKYRAFATTTHVVNGNACIHRVAAIDGAIVLLAPGERGTRHTPPADRVEIQTRPGNLFGDIEWHVTYASTCSGDTVTATVTMTDIVKNSGDTTPLANWARIIPDSDVQFARIHGWRQDAESLYATIKRPMSLDGRACSYDPDHFVVDVVGAALWLNAVAHDTHGGER